MKAIITIWATITVASWLLFGCAPAERQRQACLAAADAAKLQRAHELCSGYSWAECPEAYKQQVRDEHRGAMQSCPH